MNKFIRKKKKKQILLEQNIPLSTNVFYSEIIAALNEKSVYYSETIFRRLNKII